MIAGNGTGPAVGTSSEEIHRFESGGIAPGDFRHADHIEMAWHYLREMPLLEALPRYARGLLALATRAGRPERYHETITWAFMFVIHERVLAAPDADYPAFRGANRDLFEWPGGPLERYYRPETLASDRARRGFVMPDRIQRGPSTT